MDNSARFWDRIAARYAKTPIADDAAYQKKLAVTREYFRPDMAALEIGCGTGATALAHAPYVRQILAIDISARMIEIAQARADERRIGNVTFQRSTIDELNLPDQSLDAVLGLSILHLLEDRDEVIAKAYKMLKPGGVFVSSTACMGDTMRLLQLVTPIGQFLGLMPLVKFFTRKELEESLANAGFAIRYQWQPGKNKAVFIVATKAD